MNHPNIATIYEIDEARGVHFIAMEHRRPDAAGDSRRRTLSIPQALAFAIPVAEALANAHDKSIVHRDIKPNNIMVSDEGYVKVLDFGLAKLIADGTDADHMHTTLVTRAGTLWGTVGYMSPEQAMGVTLDQRSDIFSFGVVLYELITGQAPFGGTHAMAILHAVTFEQPTPLSRLKPEAAGELERVVNKMLQKKAGERYQHMKDTIVDLKRLQKDDGLMAHAYATRASAPAATGARIVILALLIAARRAGQPASGAEPAAGHHHRDIFALVERKHHHRDQDRAAAQDGAAGGDGHHTAAARRDGAATIADTLRLVPASTHGGRRWAASSASSLGSTPFRAACSCSSTACRTTARTKAG